MLNIFLSLFHYETQFWSPAFYEVLDMDPLNFIFLMREK